MICATPDKALSASGRSSPWVSEMSPILTSYESRAESQSVERGARRIDVIDQAPFLGLRGRHEVISIQRTLHLLVGAPAMPGVDLVEPAFGLDDVLRMPLDVGCDALKSA